MSLTNDEIMKKYHMCVEGYIKDPYKYFNIVLNEARKDERIVVVEQLKKLIEERNLNDRNNKYLIELIINEIEKDD